MEEVSIKPTLKKDLCESINKLIEELTTTGKETLDKKVLKRLFQQASVSEEYLDLSKRLLFQQLEINHAQIRYGAFLLVNEFVTRSAHFRQIFFPDLLRFLDLSLKGLVIRGKKKKTKLRPLQVGILLKKKTIQAMREWERDFQDDAHFGLTIALSYMRGLGLDLEVNEAEGGECGSNRKDLSDRTNGEVEMSLNVLRWEMEGREEEIQRTLSELHSCFTLLFPNYSDHHSSVSIRVIKDEDNSVIVETLEELKKLVSKTHLPFLKNLLLSQHVEHDAELKNRLENLQWKLEKEEARLTKLEVVESYCSESTSSDDSDWEEVDKVPEWTQLPCFSRAFTNNQVLPEMLDEDKRGKGEVLLPSKWREPIVLTDKCCRALLKNGKLCTRRDKLKCPFHGKILDRDSEGHPVNPLEREMEERRREAERMKKEDWQDPLLLKQLKVKIGLDLLIRKGRRGKRSLQEKYPSLLSISSTESPRHRLTKLLEKQESKKRRRKTPSNVDLVVDQMPL